MKYYELKKEGYSIHNTYKFLKESIDFLKYDSINWKCDSPYLYFSISPEGKFLPCVDLGGDKSMLDDNFLENYKIEQKIIRQKVKSCKGCMYACYSEISYFCKNPFILIERMLQQFKISKKLRKIYSYEEMLRLAKEMK